MNDHPATNSQPISPGRVALCTLLVAAGTVLAACTSSSSTGTPSAPATASSSGAPTSSAHKTVKPQGTPTGASIALTKVSKSEAKKLELKVVKVPGVQSVGYVPQTKSVTIYFVKAATKAQRTKATKLAHKVLHKH